MPSSAAQSLQLHSALLSFALCVQIAGCGQNSLLKSLVSTYAPSLKAVGPPLQLICGIDSNSEALDKAAGELQPYLSAPQQQQQVAPTDQLSNREEEEMPPQGVCMTFASNLRVLNQNGMRTEVHASCASSPILLMPLNSRHLSKA